MSKKKAENAQVDGAKDAQQDGPTEEQIAAAEAELLRQQMEEMKAELESLRASQKDADKIDQAAVAQKFEKLGPADYEIERSLQDRGRIITAYVKVKK